MKKGTTFLIKISPKLLGEWTRRKSYGDIKKIMDFTESSKPIVIRAVNKGIGKPELILKISEYFRDKELTDSANVSEQAFKILNVSS